MFERIVALTATALILTLTPMSAVAQEVSACQTPQFVFGFATLKAQLGDAMGEPVSCEYADPNGTGDTLQDTSTGLAFWRKSTNTPTFTNGTTHWGLAPTGLLSWTGASIDPPPSPVANSAPVLIPPAAQPAQPAPLAPTPAPRAAPAPASGCDAAANPWGYTFCGGNPISSPPTSFCSVFPCIPSFWNQTNGYVMQCRDGLFSHSGGVRGSCSSHGGNARALYTP